MPILMKTTDAGNTSDWGIIELQGDLEVRTNEDKSDQFIGDMCYNDFGQPILIIGHHILQGREQTMDKAFAIIERKNVVKCDDKREHMNHSQMADSHIERSILDSTMAQENKKRTMGEYTVRSVCTKKLIFKSRPKPIIANVKSK